MEYWLENIQPDLGTDISPALSCLWPQIILQGLGSRNSSSHTHEGWWLQRYPWWNSEPTINMYFQAKNHYSFLLLDDLRQKSYLLWLECTVFSVVLWLRSRLRIWFDWLRVAEVVWTATRVGVSKPGVSFEGGEGVRWKEAGAVCREKLFLLARSSLICC